MDVRSIGHMKQLMFADIRHEFFYFEDAEFFEKQEHERSPLSDFWTSVVSVQSRAMSCCFVAIQTIQIIPHSSNDFNIFLIFNFAIFRNASEFKFQCTTVTKCNIICKNSHAERNH